MEPKKIKCLIVRPGMEPIVDYVSNTLRGLQNVVGGYLEAITADLSRRNDGCVILVDEDGKNRKKTLCRVYEDEYGNPFDALCGTFVIVGTSGEEFRSLTDAEIMHYYIKYRR